MPEARPSQSPGSEPRGRLAELRERFLATPPVPSWLAAPRKLWRFLALSFGKARADDLTQKSASLAFVTIVSLIPLLAALSFLGARWFDQQQAVEVLSKVLPYSEAAIVEKIEEFLAQAQAIRGVGFALFLAAALAVFTQVDETINRVWNVTHRRLFRNRLLSFTLVLFWGPVVIGVTYASLYFLRNHPLVEKGPLALPANFVPFTMTLLGLSMLYWLVPNTTVRFRSALAGGLTAALLLEALRQGFGLYVDQVRSVSLIYGSFGLVLLFMISVQLAWWIVLLGSEAAYCLQNFEFMSRLRRAAGPVEGSWIALTALAFFTRRFQQGEPITPHEVLAESLQLDNEGLRKVLQPLLRDGILKEASGDLEGYLLACDPHELQVQRIFDLYEDLQWEIMAPLPEDLTSGLEALRERLLAGRVRDVEGRVLTELLPEMEKAEMERAESQATP